MLITIESGLPFFAGLVLTQVLGGVIVTMILGILAIVLKIPLQNAAGFLKTILLLIFLGVGFSIAVTPGGIAILVAEIIALIFITALSRGYGFKTGYVEGASYFPDGRIDRVRASQVTLSQKPTLEVPEAAAKSGYLKPYNVQRQKLGHPSLTEEQYNQLYPKDIFSTNKRRRYER